MSSLPEHFELLLLANQVCPGDGVAGGEKLLVELVKRWQHMLPLRLIVPEIGLPLIETELPRHLCVRLPVIFGRYPKTHFQVLSRWCELTFRASTLLGSMEEWDSVFYTSADFYCNTFPVAWAKQLKPRIFWAGVIHHIIDSPGKRNSSSSWLVNAGAFVLQRVSFQLLKRYANCIFLLNHTVKKQLKSMGFDPSKLYVTGSGIDSRLISQTMAHKTLHYDACFVGRLNATKGIRHLISAWKFVVDKIPDAKLALIGVASEQELPAIKEYVQDLKLGRSVFFLGFVPEDEKYAIMKACKVFVSLSFEEGWGMAITEALACGLPVVAWDLPVYRELYGDIVKTAPLGNTTEAAKSILDLLQNVSLCQETSARGIAIGMQYDFDVVASKQLDIIRGLKFGIRTP